MNFFYGNMKVYLMLIIIILLSYHSVAQNISLFSPDSTLEVRV